MANVALLTLASVLGVSLLSFVGVLTLRTRVLRNHFVMLTLVAFAAGTLLGDALIHLLPESVEIRDGFSPMLGLQVLAGFSAFFVLETIIRWNHEHGGTGHGAHHGQVKPFAWTNLVGDGLHNFVDGVLIAAAYIADVGTGVATTIAVAAHEIPQELGDFAVLVRAGFSRTRALLYNFFSAVAAVLGALAVLALRLEGEAVEAYALPLIAGGFIYIAAADLVPELHHHAQTRFLPVILGGLGAGVAAMWALLALEIG